MEQFVLEIELGNDAMQTPEDVAEALCLVARRLREAAALGRHASVGTIRDRNGNDVGTFQRRHVR